MTAWELHPVDKYMSRLLLITEISLVLFPAHPVNTQKAQDKYGWMNIFIILDLNTLYMIAYTPTYKTVLAETGEQVLRPGAALPSKPSV